MKPPFFLTVQHIMISYMHNSIKPYKTLLSHNLFFFESSMENIPPPGNSNRILFFGRSPQRTNQHRSPVGESATSGEYNWLLICWRGGGSTSIFQRLSAPRRISGYLFLEIFVFPNTTRIPENPKSSPKNVGSFWLEKQIQPKCSKKVELHHLRHNVLQENDCCTWMSQEVSKRLVNGF